MIYKVTHTTTYTYTEPVSMCHNELHLVPRETPRQLCLSHRLLVRPHPAALHRVMDYFGNPTNLFCIHQEHRKLVVTTSSKLEVRPAVLPALEATPAWDQVRDQSRDDVSPFGLDVMQYLFDSPQVRASAGLRDYAIGSFSAGRPLLEAVADLNRRIHADFRYDTRATTVSTPLEEVLECRGGVCQDFAHLGIGCLRSLGLPARYVSGYIRTYPPPGRPRLIGADASHAWFAVHCPGAGWVDFDPTNNSISSEEHLTLAWGRDYGDVCPVKGVVVGGGQHGLVVAVDVEPEEESVVEG